MSNYTLETLFNTYMARRHAGASPTTHCNYRGHILPVLELIGLRRRPDQVRAADFEQAHLTMKARRGKAALSPFTIDSRLRGVRAMMNWCVRQGLIDKSPLVGFRFPRLPQPKPKAISQDTFEQLLAEARQPRQRKSDEWLIARDVALLYLLRDTGARRGGISGANVDDIDLKRGRLLVTEKGSKVRHVYMSPTTLEHVKAWLVVRKKVASKASGGALFIGAFARGKRATKTRLTPEGIAQILRRLAERAGVTERTNPHAFRHAFARDMLQAGVDLTRVSQLLGHAGVQVTADYYARWADHELQAAHAAHSPITQMEAAAE